MKHKIGFLTKYWPWLLLLFGVDGLAALILWLSDVQAFRSLLAVILLGSLLLFAILLAALFHIEQKRRRAFVSFIHAPDDINEETLLRILSRSDGESIRLLGNLLRQKQDAYQQLSQQVLDYEEYVESWAHEVKTPLSLLTFLLENRREELPSAVGFKLDYVRNRMQEAVSQMLFYARLKSSHKDYVFEPLSLSDCIHDVLTDYQPLLEEKGFHVQLKLPPATVYTDRRGLGFLLSQAVSNAIKYGRSDGAPSLRFTLKQERRLLLCIQDHGVGVRNSDLPYIFQKGFTGDTGEDRRSATGMGLYLAKGVAGDLNLTLDAQSVWQQGFTLIIGFPIP